MRKFFLIAGFALLLFPLTAFGQSTPKVELFGGYSYLRADGDGDPASNLHGWNASIAGNVNHWLGLVADFSGHYGSETVTVGSARGNVDGRFHSFLFGPRVSARKNDKVTPFFHALFGASHAKANGTFTSGASTINVSDSDSAFAMALGGGMDVKLSDAVAVRLIQADYLMTRFGGSTQNNARLSFGLVLRLGKK